MNVRDLEYVVAVADRRHFGRAAAACHVSQPALSGQIRKLEERLGIALFERNKRMVRITPAGEEVVARARRVLELVDTIEEGARARRDPLSGPLRLGMIPTVGPSLTPLLLPQVARHLPNVELGLSEDLTASLEGRLTDGRIDAAILATPVSGPRLAEMALYDEPFRVALPPEHPLARREAVDVSEIAREQFLLLEDGHCLRDQVLSWCSERLPASPEVRTQHTSLTTLLALVGAGAGVTLAPAMSVARGWTGDGGVVIRPERSGTARRAVRLAFRKSFPRRPLLRRLADLVRGIVPDTVVPRRS